MDDCIIRKVFINKANKQKLVTISSKSNIKEGDFVAIKKIKPFFKQK